MANGESVCHGLPIALVAALTGAIRDAIVAGDLEGARVAWEALGRILDGTGARREKL
jgi:hypothetical protein